MQFSLSHNNDSWASNYGIKNKFNSFDPNLPKIICLIAMYGRHAIMQLNLELLKKQTIPIMILVIVSTKVDFDFIVDLQDPCILPYPAVNSPLGLKWQLGIKACRYFDPDFIIILGSDDLLSLNYCEQVSRLMRELNADMMGTQNWYIYDYANGTVYATRYLHGNRSLGAGRIYSKRILDKAKWVIYDVRLGKGLDKQSQHVVQRFGGKIYHFHSNLSTYFRKGHDGISSSVEEVPKGNDEVSSSVEEVPKGNDEISSSVEEVAVLSYKGEWQMLNNLGQIRASNQHVYMSKLSMDNTNFFQKFFDRDELLLIYRQM